MKLTGGLEAILADVELPAGNISQIRLILGENNSLTINGQTQNLTIPSGSQSGLKLNVNIELVEGITYKILLDFEAAKSVVEAGNSGIYNLKPVIRVSKRLEKSPKPLLILVQEGLICVEVMPVCAWLT